MEGKWHLVKNFYIEDRETACMTTEDVERFHWDQVKLQF